MKTAAILLATCCAMAQVRVPAFPGAEGAGAFATGGRGGAVYHVTNLQAQGSGSLADAVSQGARTVVFDVSGVIDMEGKSIKVTEPNITIAGQTAPGEGICIRNGALQISASNVVVRHVRIRRGFFRKGDMGDALGIKGDIENIIADHVSTSWATDENMTLTNARSVTAQYSIAAEGLDYFNPNQTPNRHAFGSLFGSKTAGAFMTIHHSIYAHNRLRNARTTGGDDGPPILDFRNNVIYDAKELTSHTGSQAVHANWINNIVKDGPSTGIEGHDVKGVLFTFLSAEPHKLHATGNWIQGYPDRSEDNWLAVRYDRKGMDLKAETLRANQPFVTPHVTTQTAHAAFETVLANAGCTLPGRDLVDWRIIRDIRRGTGAVINLETDLTPAARWPAYHSLPAPADTDGDGIPDYWEQQFGFDRQDPSDAMRDEDGDGYTNLEAYLNNTHPRGGAEPIIFVSASISRAWRQGGEAGEFQIARSGSFAKALPVRFKLGGELRSAEIPSGAQAISIPVPPDQGSGERIVVLELSTGEQCKSGLPRAALVAIEDGNAPPPADVTAIAPDGGGDSGDRRKAREALPAHKEKVKEKRSHANPS